MNPTKRHWKLIGLFAVVLVLIGTGCRNADTEPIPTKEEIFPETEAPPKNTEIVVVTETLPEAEEVIASRSAICLMENFTEYSGTMVTDPELGRTDRGFVIKWVFKCDDPYLDGKAIGVQDGHDITGGYFYNGYYEIVTDEGGVWKGTGDNTYRNGATTAEGVYQGEGKYEGLVMRIKYILPTNKMSLRVSRPAVIEPNPTAVIGTVVAEREVNCPLTKISSTRGVMIKDDPKYSNMERGLHIKTRQTCSEPYLKGNAQWVGDISKNSSLWEVFYFSEIVTSENGVWKGYCQGSQTPDSDFPEKGECLLNGESVYKGLQMILEWEGDNEKIKVIQSEQ